MTSGSQSLWPVLFEALGQTLQMVFVTLGIGGLAGLLLGLGLYTTRQGNLLSTRPIPFIIFISAMLPLTIKVTGTSFGPTAAIFPMSIMATVATSRIVEQNIVALDPGLIEAARAMGASPLRIIATVIIPEALGPLILGYTFLFVGITDMSAMAGAVAGGGLGDFAIVYGYQRYNFVVTWIAVGAIIVVVQLAQLVGNILARRVLRR